MTSSVTSSLQPLELIGLSYPKPSCWSRFCASLTGKRQRSYAEYMERATLCSNSCDRSWYHQRARRQDPLAYYTWSRRVVKMMPSLPPHPPPTPPPEPSPTPPPEPTTTPPMPPLPPSQPQTPPSPSRPPSPAYPAEPPSSPTPPPAPPSPEAFFSSRREETRKQKIEDRRRCIDFTLQVTDEFPALEKNEIINIVREYFPRRSREEIVALVITVAGLQFCQEHDSSALLQYLEETFHVDSDKIPSWAHDIQELILQGRETPLDKCDSLGMKALQKIMKRAESEDIPLEEIKESDSSFTLVHTKEREKRSACITATLHYIQNRPWTKESLIRYLESNGLVGNEEGVALVASLSALHFALSESNERENINAYLLREFPGFKNAALFDSIVSVAIHQGFPFLNLLEKGKIADSLRIELCELMNLAWSSRKAI